MSYENAPATKLLATHCGICGRPLRDSVSVERCVGPDCAALYLVPEAQGEPDWMKACAILVALQLDIEIDANDSPRVAVNRLVSLLACPRNGFERHEAEGVFLAIYALGFTALADRIAKRFRAKVEFIARRHAHKIEMASNAPAKVAEENVDELRAEFARVRDAFTYDNAGRDEFFALCRKQNPQTPAEWVKVAKSISCPCRRCMGTGYYVRGTINGRPNVSESICFRCEGRGFQTADDGFRNRTYDQHRVAEAARAS